MDHYGRSPLEPLMDALRAEHDVWRAALRDVMRRDRWAREYVPDAPTLDRLDRPEKRWIIDLDAPYLVRRWPPAPRCGKRTRDEMYECPLPEGHAGPCVCGVRP